MIVENRKKLIPVTDTIKLCGRLGLSLRGHRDDSIYHPVVGCYSAGGIGNFVELLNYRVWRVGWYQLGDHLIKHKNNASYISKSTQNDLTKCSNKEHMSLVLRYVDKKNNIREGSIYPLWWRKNCQVQIF